MGNMCATSGRGYTPEVRGGKAERLLNKLCETFKKITVQSSNNPDQTVVSLKLVKRFVSLITDSNRQSVKLLRILRDDESSSGLVKNIRDLRSGANKFLKDLLDHLRKLEKETRELLGALQRWTASPDGEEENEEPRGRWWNLLKWLWKRLDGKDAREVLRKLSKFDSGKNFCVDFQNSLNLWVVQQHGILKNFESKEISKSIRPQHLKTVIAIILRGFLFASLIASMAAALGDVNLTLVYGVMSDVVNAMMELVNSESLATWMDGLWKTKLNSLQLDKAHGTRGGCARDDKEAMLRELLPVYSSVEDLKREMQKRRSAKELHQTKMKLQKKLSKAIHHINDSIKEVQSCKKNIDRRGQGSSNTNV